VRHVVATVILLHVVIVLLPHIILTTACCLAPVGLGLLDSVSGWLVVMHTYLYYFPLSLYRTLLLLPVELYDSRSQKKEKNNI